MQRFAATKKELLPTSSVRKIFDLINAEMKLVEAEFERQARSNIQVIGYLGDYIRASGGKRVRPALVVLANYAVGGDGSSANSIKLATVMEMLHTATLVHDDIIDNADVRRNRPSVNARFGNQSAVLMGDWLYMSAFETALEERSLEILDILTQLTRKMTEGELIQMTLIGRLDITEKDYFDILRRKTAYLFSACCEIGAILAGASDEMRAAMRSYGLDLGIAFQLADDLLDLTADDDSLGKAAGVDLLEGKLTLPLIMLAAAEPSVVGEFERVMLTGSYDDFSRAALIDMLYSHGIVEAIRDRAKAHNASAKKSLDVLAKSAYRTALEEIPQFVIQRSN